MSGGIQRRNQCCRRTKTDFKTVIVAVPATANTTVQGRYNYTYTYTDPKPQSELLKQQREAPLETSIFADDDNFQSQ